MRRLSLGALSLAVISPFLACGASDNAATRREPVPINNVQTANAQASPASTPTARQEDVTPSSSAAEIPVYNYEVVNAYPHDPKAFTQGLFFYDKNLYESTGHHGTSTLRRIELKTGKVKKKIDVPQEYFAEGITIFEDKIFQLTWQSHKCFVYDAKSFDLLSELHNTGEGWGLTNDGKHLILSDGTNQLRFLEPNTFLTVRTISVLSNGYPLAQLNELEYVKGEIYANVWKSDRIARIDPATGHVIGWIDLTGLRPTDVPDELDNVLNGIAYDEKEDRLFVTGKRWTKLFEIRLRQQFKN